MTNIFPDFYPERTINTRCLSWNSRLGFWKNSQAIMRLQRRVIRRWNGNFVDFQGTFLKNVKNFPIKRNSHFSGKRQKWQTRIWNLTSNPEAVWGQYGLKRVSFVIYHAKYCREMVFFGHKLIRGHFAIDQILLQKQEFLQFSL